MRMRTNLIATIVVGAWLAISLNSSAQELKGHANTINEFLDVLRTAKAKSAARQWPEAVQNWKRVVQINPVNEEYWQQLAQAHLKNGDPREAIPAFEQVLKLGGYCFPSETAYSIARSYALVGEKESAMSWLQDAFARGYRDLDFARNDSTFTALHDDPRFIALMGGATPAGMSRVEGWRYDLSLLEQELQRKAYPRFVGLTQEELHDEVTKLSHAIPTLSDVQATIGVMKLVAKMRGGHTEAWPQYANEFATTLPLKFFLFKEGLYVIAADPKYKELLGAQVVRFGNTSASQAMAAVEPLVFRENLMFADTFGPYLLRFPALLKGLSLIDDSIEVPLTIRDAAGRTRTVSVTPDSNNPNIWNVYPFPKTWVGLPRQALYLKNMERLYWFEYLPDSHAVYFQYNRVLPDSKEPFDVFVRRLFEFVDHHNVTKLVIDLRWNNGGNTYLVPPLVHAIIGSRKINRDGRLFVIVGRRTFSAAENLAGYLQRETNAIFVGEPTGGKPNSVGDEFYFSMPYSKMTADVADVYYESSWPEDFRNWIAPQIFVEPTFADFSSNQDPVLDAVLGFRAPGFTVSQHPGFWCKAESQLDIEEDKSEPMPPATRLRQDPHIIVPGSHAAENDSVSELR
jgi:tetratricopeptide (TPR) repeat protein